MWNLLVVLFRHTFIMLAFPIALAATASAQALPGATSAEQERARVRADRDMAAREWELRNIGKVKKVDVDVASPRVQLVKVKEDYEGIQQANNTILTMLAAGKELDYKVIADAASEIKKHAGRLKSYLVMLQLVADDKDRKKNLNEIELSEMRGSLLALDAAIIKLIDNPVFNDFGKVVDANSSTKALDNLYNIMELSERIKRSVERSMKTTRASR